MDIWNELYNAAVKVQNNRAISPFIEAGGVVAVMPDGRVGPPCGACREFMMQLDKDSGEIEILLDLETRKTIRLKELIPDWWGAERFAECEAKGENHERIPGK